MITKWLSAPNSLGMKRKFSWNYTRVENIKETTITKQCGSTLHGYKTDKTNAKIKAITRYSVNQPFFDIPCLIRFSSARAAFLTSPDSKILLQRPRKDRFSSSASISSISAAIFELRPPHSGHLVSFACRGRPQIGHLFIFSTPDVQYFNLARLFSRFSVFKRI